MRITKIEIGHFGKWENFTLDFSDGIQVIYGQNEAGKSTICAFLQAMFYGLPNEKKSIGIREDLRKRYAPWDGSPMEGTVHFTHEGRSYVLSRRLGKTRKNDKVSLKDAQTWEEMKEIPLDDIGRIFFGVGEDAFLKTLFISQLGAAIRAGDEDEILKRLSNLKQSGSEDISYQTAAAALDKAKRDLLSKNEKAGLIPRTQQEKEQLEYEYKEAVRLSEQFRTDVLCRAELTRMGEELRSEAESLAAQKELCKQHALFCTEQKTDIERQTLIERKTEQKNKIEEKKQRIKDIAQELEAYQGMENISQQDLLALLQMENDIEHLRLEQKEYAGKQEELDELNEKIAFLAKGRKTKMRMCFFVFGLLFILLGVALGLALSPTAFVFCAPGMLGLILSFVGGRTKSAAMGQLQKRAEFLRLELSAYPKEEKKESLSSFEKMFSDRLGVAGVSEVSELSLRFEQRTVLMQEQATVEREMELLLKENERLEEDLERLPQKSEQEFSPEAINYNGKSVEEIDQLLNENHEKQLENQRTEEAVRYSVEHAFSGTRSVDVILTELAQKEEQLAEYRFHYEALTLAEEALGKSYLELKEDFAPVLNEKVGEILSALTDGKYSELKISDEYKVMLKERGKMEPVSAEHLSNGTYDILYLALRLGIAQVIFPKGIPFLMLDDSFLQLDDMRAERAATYLKEKANAEQIFYFTCHSSQAVLFGEGASRIQL